MWLSARYASSSQSNAVCAFAHFVASVLDHIHAVFSTFVSTEYIIIFIPCVSLTWFRYFHFQFLLFRAAHMIARVCCVFHANCWSGFSLSVDGPMLRIVKCAIQNPGSDGRNKTRIDWHPETQKEIFFSC